MKSTRSFYKITPIQPTGYRLEWWGVDGTHFWDYRKFGTVEEAEAAAVFSREQYTFNGYCEEAYPINNELSVCDTFYRHWLIGTSWDDELELIDPQTNESHRLPFGDKHLCLHEEISRAKGWIDAFLKERKALIHKKTQQDSFFTSWRLIADSRELLAKSAALIAKRRAILAESAALIAERRAILDESRALRQQIVTKNKNFVCVHNSECMVYRCPKIGSSIANSVP